MYNMKSVKEIYEYFKQFPNAKKQSGSLLDFLQTIPGFSTNNDSSSGLQSMNMTMGMEYLHICEKMCGDLLLIKVKPASIIKIDPHYIYVNSVNSSDPSGFIHELDYGLYDFKYRGFVYTRIFFEQ